MGENRPQKEQPGKAVLWLGKAEIGENEAEGGAFGV